MFDYIIIDYITLHSNMSRRTGKKVDRFVDLEIPEYWRSTVVSLDFELTCVLSLSNPFIDAQR